MDVDLVIRNGTIVDGTGAPAYIGDVGISEDRVVAVEPGLPARGHREIDAGGRLVTPGFIDIHTHLDAQLAWDPLASSSCWHGVTSVVVGNCGATFAPCQEEDRGYLAELMASMGALPDAAATDDVGWDWVTFGEYLGSLDRTPKGPNAGGMVGHCAIRHHAMGERASDDEPAGPEDIGAMVELVEEAMQSGALGFSTSRTLRHTTADGRPAPGTTARHDELCAIAAVLGRHRKGVISSASDLGEADLVGSRAELAWMGEVSRRSGRPVTFGVVQSDHSPDLFRRVVDLAKEENATGGCIRPQTSARSRGVLFSLPSRTPFDASPAWRELRGLSLQEQLLHLRDAPRRAGLITDADECPPLFDLDSLFVLPPGPARYDCQADTSLMAHASLRGVSPAAAFIELLLETDGALVCHYACDNRYLGAVEEMLDQPVVALGLANTGAHIGRFVDASQPTFLLTYWVRERGRWDVEEGVRRLTSDAAGLFGLQQRGVLRPGAFADVNVIDLEALTLFQPEFVTDGPGGAGRYIQASTGYDYTLVNGVVYMDHGEHTGALAGRVLRSGA